MSKVFAIVPIYNRWRYTNECVSSLLRQKKVDVEIILVDSGSTDSTDKLVSKHFGQTVTYIQGRSSWWWTKSTNVGVDYALGLAKSDDYILLMNNDCFVATNYLAGLLNLARTNPNSIFGSICLDCDRNNRVVEVGIAIDWSSGEVKPLTDIYGWKRRGYRNLETITDSDALPGKGSLIPVRAFERLGTFAIHLPHYLADYEFSMRAKNHGYKILIQTTYPVYHHWRATGNAFSPKRKRYTYREVWQLLFGRKSMNNIIDWLIFIWLVCPPKYRMRNFFILVRRLVSRLGVLAPFYYFVGDPMTKKLSFRIH